VCCSVLQCVAVCCDHNSSTLTHSMVRSASSSYVFFVLYLRLVERGRERDIGRVGGGGGGRGKEREAFLSQILLASC